MRLAAHYQRFGQRILRWALIVIAPGAIQQVGRIAKGDSAKYFGEN